MFSESCFQSLTNTIDIIVRLAHYSDQRMVESSTLSLHRIAVWCSKDVSKMESLFQHQIVSSLVEKLNSLLSNPKDLKTIGSMIKVMEQLCKSKSLCQYLIADLNLFGICQKMMSNFSNSNNPRHLELNLSILDLLGGLLPALPSEGIFRISPLKSVEREEKSIEVDANLVKLFKNDVLQSLCRMFSSSSSTPLRKKAIIPILQIVWYHEVDETIGSMLGNTEFIRVIIEIVGLVDIDKPTAEDFGMCLGILVLTEILLEKYGGNYQDSLLSKGYKESIAKLETSLKACYAQNYIGEKDNFDRDIENFIIISNNNHLVENEESSETVVATDAQEMVNALTKLTYRDVAHASWTRERFSLKTLILRVHFVSQKQLDLLNQLVPQQVKNSEMEKKLNEIQDSIKLVGSQTFSPTTRKQLLDELTKFGNLFTRDKDGEFLFGLTGNDGLANGVCQFLLEFLTFTTFECLSNANSPASTGTNYSANLNERISILNEAVSVAEFQSLLVFINDYVSRIEKFKPRLMQKHTSTLFSSRSFQLLSNVTRQVKLSLKADEDFGIPISLRSLSITIPAISSMRSVEHYIKTRIGMDTESSAENEIEELDHEVDSEDESLDGASPSKDVRVDLSKAPATENFSIEFFKEGKVLSKDKSVLHALLNFMDRKSDLATVLETTHVLKFFKNEIVPGENGTIQVSYHDCECEICSTFGGLSLADSQDIPDAMQTPLKLLSVLNCIANGNIRGITESSFYNTRLKSKIEKQMMDPLVCVADVHPEWVRFLLSYHPYTLPFQTRLRLFATSALGQSRNLVNWLTYNKESFESVKSRFPSLTRSQKCKIAVGREETLKNMFLLLGSKKTLRNEFEVEFLNEAGTGLGPTVEFFSLVSRELCAPCGVQSSKDNQFLPIWRNPDDGSINALYPRPNSNNTE